LKIKGVAYEVVDEQEPLSGGKKSAEATVRNLARIWRFADRSTGSKEIRSEPIAATNAMKCGEKRIHVRSNWNERSAMPADWTGTPVT
jgi:hypothetical protein